MISKVLNAALAIICLSGLAIAATADAAAVSYTYDALDRLTSASFNNGQKVITYAYDAAGNIRSKTIVINNDTDGDGVPDDQDAFPNDPTEWSDTDGDGIGNNTDTDDDNDGIDDTTDNCPEVANGDQADLDGDGLGDACDNDDDGDGVPDGDDAFPRDPTESVDSDGDGFGDNSDPYPLTASVFFDVQPDYWAVTFIEALAAANITGGCGNENYCPDEEVTRAQMAVFLERGMRGSEFSPPVAAGNVFLDVSVDYWAAAWIEQLYLDGITGGCGGNSYCPDDPVSRAQMAVFLLRAKYGSDYLPSAPSGVFADVDTSYWAAAWIEQLAAEGITGGCGDGNYCPDESVTRGQMAVFLVRTFGL